VLIAFMLINITIQIQWLSHAAVVRPAEVFYKGQFNVNSFYNIDFLATIYMLIFILFSFPASYIIDTYGIKKGIGFGAILAGISALTKGFFAQNLQIVMVSQVGLAIAQPFIINAVTALTARWFPLKERALAAGFAALAQYLGIMAAMLIAPIMIGSNPNKPGYGTGFDKMLMLYGIITAITAVLAILFIKDKDYITDANNQNYRLKFKEGLKHIFKQRDMLLTILLFLIGLGIFNAISAMTDSIAAKIGVVDSDGLIGGLMLIGGIIGAIIIPTLSDKFQKRKLFIVICLAGMVPSVFVLSFANIFSSNISSIYNIALTASFFLGFFVMSAGPIGFQYAAEVNYPAPESTSQGLLMFSGQVTGIIFVTAMSIKNNMYLESYLVAFVFLTAIAFVGVLFLKESPMVGK